MGSSKPNCAAQLPFAPLFAWDATAGPFVGTCPATGASHRRQYAPPPPVAYTRKWRNRTKLRLRQKPRSASSCERLMPVLTLRHQTPDTSNPKVQRSTRSPGRLRKAQPCPCQTGRSSPCPCLAQPSRRPQASDVGGASGLLGLYGFMGGGHGPAHSPAGPGTPTAWAGLAFAALAGRGACESATLRIRLWAS